MTLAQINNLVDKLDGLGMKPEIHKSNEFYDEPKFFNYNTTLSMSRKYTDGNILENNDIGSGTSFFNPEEALSKSIFEAMERFSSQCYKKKDINYAAYINNASGFVDPVQFLAEAKTRSQKLGWVEGDSLLKNKKVFLPAQLVFYNYKRREGEPALPYPKNSNGVAAGENHEHAVINGIYEIVERDAFVSCYLNKITPPRVDLKGIRNKKLDDILERCARYKLELQVMDMTNDVRIPSYIAVLIDKRGGPPLAFGCKSGLRKSEAIIGAIKEALMLRTYIKSLMQNGAFFEEGQGKNGKFVERVKYWLFPKVVKNLHFLLSGSLSKTSIRDFEGGLKEEYAEVIKQMNIRSLDVYARDVTLKVFKNSNFCVYRVIIPHLQPLYLHEHEKDGAINVARLKEVANFFGKKYTGPNIIPHPFL